MTIREQITTDNLHSLVLVEGLLCSDDTAITDSVVLVPNYERALQCRKAWAQNELSFGLSIETFDSWVQRRWDLHGDGRTLVSPLERDLLMQAALSEMALSGRLNNIKASPGTVRMLSAIAREAFDTVLSRHEELRGSGSFTAAEKEASAALEAYGALLHERNLCEQSQAMALLTPQDFAASKVIALGFEGFSFEEGNALERLSETSAVYWIHDSFCQGLQHQGRPDELERLLGSLFAPDPDAPVVPTGAVRFLLPAGAYALPYLLGQALEEAIDRRPEKRGQSPFPGGTEKRGLSPFLGQGRMCVSSSDPAALFDALAPHLEKRGIESRLRFRQAFSACGFGRAFTSLWRFLHDTGPSVSGLSNFASSPFSGISQKRAFELDASWRGNRAIGKERCLADLCEAGEAPAELLEALQRGDLRLSLECFERTVRKWRDVPEAYRGEQLGAIAAARSFFDACASLGLEAEGAFPLLEQRMVDCSRVLRADSSTQPAAIVEFMSLPELSQQDPASARYVFLCDLDSQSYPVRERDDAKSLLFEKLGIASASGALEAARMQFYRAASVAQEGLYCARPLNTFDADPTYPAVVWEELADCYRSDLNAREGEEKAAGLPGILSGYIAYAGEDELYRSVTLEPEAPGCEKVIQDLPRGAVSGSSKDKVILQKIEDGEGNELGKLLSPSAIETYLECPYKWFTLRRLRLEGIDAGFGAMEKGNFAHAVLKDFYLKFQQQIGQAVDEANKADARALMSELFDQMAGQQDSMPADRHPLIPLSELEWLEMAAFKRQLLDMVGREARFLPGFSPYRLEMDFGNNEPFPYAGVYLRGQIDRIDVDEHGRAVVIDYKGSLSKDYGFQAQSGLSWLQDEEGQAVVLPERVQALLYAQVVRKMLGLEVVGALYHSYGKAPKTAGLYDPRVLGAAELPFSKASESALDCEAQGTMSDVLDQVEHSIGIAHARMLDSYIMPHPRGSDPCGFCPVTSCERRGMHES